MPTVRGTPAELAAAVVLMSLLVIACVSDVRARRIPNPLVATVLVGGLLASVALDPVLPGLLRSAAGVAVGLLIWLPGWLLRMMGAGDVKLFAAAGAWVGPAGAVNAAIAAAVLGGLLALVWLVLRRGGGAAHRTLWTAAVAPRTLIDARSESKSTRELVPYSLAIAGGVAVQLVFPGLVLG